MSRHRLPVSILVAAAVNVATAWFIALLGPPTEFGDVAVAETELWREFANSEWPLGAAIHLESRHIGATCTQLTSGFRPDGKIYGIREWRYGLPLRSMRAVRTTVLDADCGRLQMDTYSGFEWAGRLFPLQPRLLWFVANVLIYVAALELLGYMWLSIRRLTRRRAGACPDCGFPASIDQYCPECGSLRG